ncbi:pyridoxal 5'-phosphate synthase glutaminase subunit PdxT [Serinibacter salmoneus]|uniref:Pyridoxal 5'-phosphate synthase subunit PdxT n=1 Tax=Serinibacter salmoneus TaxID=556530 RepID=A0A2A9CYU7_9MICO|nr:pyridoxal 5'-phosphate synthase glutaminase subunit PdxT [Serinibacter salmoneus]PFG19607.1 pyridoxal phosphate synthase yaaE subunit [Serinibacter salmoneus]
MTGRTIGVLALQGDVAEHVRAVEALGETAVPVRRERELARIDGLILPGGESSTIEKLLRRLELFAPLRDALRGGLPAYGSCAGMILLAEEIQDAITGQTGLGGIPMTVRRNAFGRQVDSFEADLVAPALTGDPAPIRAVFIRAPWVERVGEGVEVLARLPDGGPAAGRIVAIRAGVLMATSFHPEVSGDLRVHREFARLVRGVG